MKFPNRPGQFDYILVGGGLQSGLIALALRHHRPESSVLLIERDASLGGNHTWSFHPGDVPESSQVWIAPIVKHHWPQYRVRLDNFSRRVGLAYASVPSDHFANVVAGLFDSESNDLDCDNARCQVRDRQAPRLEENFYGPAKETTATLARPSSGVEISEATPSTGDWKLMTHTEVINVSEDTVLTSCGTAIQGKLIIDCRGPSPERQIFAGCGYQKFYGFEVELNEDWPLREPIIMDAVADQQDGFRFLYTLPFSPRRVLIEDTRFSDAPTIERQECLAQVTDYLHGQGIFDFDIVREESGVLPMPFTAELRPEARSPLAGGYAGGWFHAATGYSFPLAVAFAETVASAAPGRLARRSTNWRRNTAGSQLMPDS